MCVGWIERDDEELAVETFSGRWKDKREIKGREVSLMTGKGDLVTSLECIE